MFTESRLEFWHKVAAHRQKDLIVVLEDVWDPHNAAAIFRSGDAFGIQNFHLIFEKQKAFDPKRVGKRSSGRANKWLDFEIFDNSEACFKKLKAEGYDIFITEINENAQELYKTDFLKSEKIALVIGNEHDGISGTARAYAHQTIYIPMTGFVESFNVSVASSLCIAEITRQRNQDENPEKFRLNEKAQATLVEKFQQIQFDKRTFKLRKRNARG